MFSNDHVTGRRDGNKFGNPFHDANYNRLNNVHILSDNFGVIKFLDKKSDEIITAYSGSVKLFLFFYDGKNFND